MANEQRPMVYCNGLNKDGVPCLLKEDCGRFKQGINQRTDYWMAWAPFKEKLGKLICTYKITIDGGETPTT